MKLDKVIQQYQISSETINCDTIIYVPESLESQLINQLDSLSDDDLHMNGRSKYCKNEVISKDNKVSCRFYHVIKLSVFTRYRFYIDL